MAPGAYREYSAACMRKGGFLVTAVAVLALTLGGVARADDWWPHPDDATWTYAVDGQPLQPDLTKEKVTVKGQKGKAFTLTWTTKDQGNSGDSPLSFGDMAFQETTAGLINTGWASNPPPPDFPILCPQIGGCNNSLASTMYYLIWGSRSPVLAVAAPAGDDVAGHGRRAERRVEHVELRRDARRQGSCVPDGSSPRRCEPRSTQAGALGDPYGSGVRTVWWVFGVGPVKMTFEHAGGADAPVTTSELQATNLTREGAARRRELLPAHEGTEDARTAGRTRST